MHTSNVSHFILGIVTYLNQADAVSSYLFLHPIFSLTPRGGQQSNGLLQVNSAGNAVMRVETTPTVPGTRKSVRIETKNRFNGGLLLMDAVHMPTGCGTWPYV